MVFNAYIKDGIDYRLTKGVPEYVLKNIVYGEGEYEKDRLFRLSEKISEKKFKKPFVIINFKDKKALISSIFNYSNYKLLKENAKSHGSKWNIKYKRG